MRPDRFITNGIKHNVAQRVSWFLVCYLLLCAAAWAQPPNAVPASTKYILVFKADAEPSVTANELANVHRLTVQQLVEEHDLVRIPGTEGRL